MSSFVSASIAVQVQQSPAVGSVARLLPATFFCFAPTKLQISSHWTRFASTPRTALSWWASAASPASHSSLSTVLIETSATRLIDRIDEPSHSIERIWTRLVRGSLFMPDHTDIYA